MNKAFLLIPFMVLLATSCGGGHITTTPVVRNTPSAVLSTPKKNNLVPPSGYTDSFGFNCVIAEPSSNGSYQFTLLDGSATTGTDLAYPVLKVSYAPDRTNYFYLNYRDFEISISDYVSNLNYSNCLYFPNAERSYGLFSHPADMSWPITITGVFNFKPQEHAYKNGYDNGEQTGYQEGRKEGYDSGYQNGMSDVYNVESNKLIPNGQYTGFSIFPKRKYLQNLAKRVVSGLEQLQNGSLDLIDTNGNYTIYIKWSYSYPKTTFQDSSNEILGELYWDKIISGDWSTSWFYLYDKELHYFTKPKTYATNGSIDTSFYPEVYLGSTFTGGDANLYFSGGGNGYQMGFADGQSYTIHSSETYKNIFTIFTPAFKAVADFFNLNIGPFKVWYFFAIPLIVTLLILVLRLVKH